MRAKGKAEKEGGNTGQAEAWRGREGNVEGQTIMKSTIYEEHNNNKQEQTKNALSKATGSITSKVTAAQARIHRHQSSPSSLIISVRKHLMNMNTF